MSAGQYAWQGFKPTLKVLLTIGCGFVITRQGLFPAVASKATAHICMTIALPCLLFSSMISSFDSDNISNFGPLAMLAIIFQLVGFSAGLLIREVFYVPADFQYGLVILMGISNWGNLPTAIVQSVALQDPFDPSVDSALGVAYVSCFIFIMQLTFYGTGLYNLCGWDYRENRPAIPRTFAGRVSRRKRQVQHLFGKPKPQNKEEFSEEMTTGLPHAPEPKLEANEATGYETPFAADVPDAVIRSPTVTEDAPARPRTTVGQTVLTSLKTLLQPITLAVLLSIPFSVINPLKALIYPTEGWSGSKIGNAPDGFPPLNFIFEWTDFVGAIAIPTSLILLGASFARLKVTKERVRKLPIAAILAATTAKMIIVPIINVLITVGFRQTTDLLPLDERMLNLVAFLSAGSPSAVNQLVATSIFLKDGQSMDTLALFLVAQYALLAIQSTVLTAVSLWLIG